MPEFTYIARDRSGQRISGTLSAGSQREAIVALSAQSLFPVTVTADTAKKPLFRLGGRVRGQLMAATYTQLAALLRSGVPLLRSLDVLRLQTSQTTLKRVLGEVHERVEDGTTLAEGMARHPQVFSEMAVSMVRAGGEGGFLEDALERVSQFTELQEDLKSRTIGALIYPVILASVGTAVVTVLIVFFVPMFATLFDQLRQRNQLPVATDMLLAFSAFMRSWGWLAAVAIGVGAVAARYHLATERGRRLADLAKLRAPLGGVIFRSLAVARFCRVLGTLLRNGVPILKSLDISRSATGNRILSDAIAEASENISAGQSLAAPLAASGHFPTAVVEMIAVAEESNTLDQVLIQIADDLERRTTRRLDLLVRMIEPVLLVILAMVVLFVVIALLLPVVRMGGMVG